MNKVIIDESVIHQLLQERVRDARRMLELFDPLIETLRAFCVRHGISEDVLADGLVGMVLGRYLEPDYDLDRAMSEVRSAMERMRDGKAELDAKTH